MAIFFDKAGSSQQEVLYQYARYSQAMTEADRNVLEEMIVDGVYNVGMEEVDK